MISGYHTSNMVLGLKGQRLGLTLRVVSARGHVPVTAASFATENALKCTTSRVKIPPHGEVAYCFQPQIPPCSSHAFSTVYGIDVSAKWSALNHSVYVLMISEIANHSQMAGTTNMTNQQEIQNIGDQNVTLRASQSLAPVRHTTKPPTLTELIQAWRQHCYITRILKVYNLRSATTINTIAKKRQEKSRTFINMTGEKRNWTMIYLR